MSKSDKLSAASATLVALIALSGQAPHGKQQQTKAGSAKQPQVQGQSLPVTLPKPLGIGREATPQEVAGALRDVLAEWNAIFDALGRPSVG